MAVGIATRSTLPQHDEMLKVAVKAKKTAETALTKAADAATNAAEASSVAAAAAVANDVAFWEKLHGRDGRGNEPFNTAAAYAAKEALTAGRETAAAEEAAETEAKAAAAKAGRLFGLAVTALDKALTNVNNIPKTNNPIYTPHLVAASRSARGGAFAH